MGQLGVVSAAAANCSISTIIVSSDARHRRMPRLTQLEMASRSMDRERPRATAAGTRWLTGSALPSAAPASMMTSKAKSKGLRGEAS